MAGWNQIVNDIDENALLENKRQHFLEELHKITGRNVIVYYSAWQQKPGVRGSFSIEDDDLNGFMSAIKGMDKTCGLDLVLHTPGGELGATQKIVSYLKSVFDNDFRVIVPHSAMSAGTMLACASKEIVMGKHSFLGPIDPQINGVPSNEIERTINNLKKDLNEGINLPYWREYINQMPPQLEGVIMNVIEHSKQMVTAWLADNMMKEIPEEAEKTVTYLSSYDIHKQHNNCLCIKTLKDQTKLEITELEKDEEFQDAVLSVYHTYQILASRANITKIIESHTCNRFVRRYR